MEINYWHVSHPNGVCVVNRNLHSSVLFMGKVGDPHCEAALRFCQANFSRVTHALGEWNQPLHEGVSEWRGTFIISYLSRWVVPPWLLEQALGAAINFHPGTPEYPGIGCCNFALYEG